MGEVVDARAYDRAVYARYEADKKAEWEQMEEDDFAVCHGLQNDSGHYKQWKETHDCAQYPNHSGSVCAVCGKDI